MRVAYVTMQFPAPSETFAGTDVAALLARGVDVEVFTMRPSHDDHDRMVRARGLDGVPIHALDARDFFVGLVWLVARPRWSWPLVAWNLRWHLGDLRALVRCLALMPRALTIFGRIAAGRFDVVHLFWGNYPAMVGLLVQLRLPATVSSMFLGAYDLDTGRYGGWLPGSAPVARRAEFVWTHAEANLPRLRSLGVPSERMRVVHRGIDVAALPLREDGAPRAPSVVTVGSLIERKGMDDALRVVERVRERVPGVRLDVVGDGPERAALEGVARTLHVDAVVTFHGHLGANDVAERLRSAAAFLLMSRDDRIPNVVKEAMASGAPCVVTATQGMEELVVHERTGYCVDVGDVDAAARHLVGVLEDPVGHEPMVAAARAKVVEEYSVDRAMAVYESAWREARANRFAATPDPRFGTDPRGVDGAPSVVAPNARADEGA